MRRRWVQVWFWSIALGALSHGTVHAGNSTGSLVVLVDFQAHHKVAVDACRAVFPQAVKPMQAAFDAWHQVHGKAQQRLQAKMVRQSDQPKEMKAALVEIGKESQANFRKQIEALTPAQREAFCKSGYADSLKEESIQFANWPEASKQ